MRNKNSYSARTCEIGLILLAAFAAVAVLADGNIDMTEKFAWSENSGWQNWRPTTNGGVTVVNNGANGYLYGYAWGENIG